MPPPGLDPMQLFLGGTSVAMTLLVSIVSFFTVRLINKVEQRLDLHETRIGGLESHVAVLRDRDSRTA
jgi:hypothetical protein